VVIKEFDFSNHPNWYNITQERGQYAWKIAILLDTIAAYGGLVMWMDSGNNIHNDMYTKVWREIGKTGIYSNPTGGSLKK